MSETLDITGQILSDIRDEIRGTNVRLDHAAAHLGGRIDALGAQLGGRIDTVVARLDAHDRILLRIADQLGTHTGQLDTHTGQFEAITARLDRLEHGQRVTNTRLEALVDVAGLVVDRGERIDQAIAELRRRVGLLERPSP